MIKPTEPTIIINGTLLSSRQAMAVRVALEAFTSDLSENGLGDDKTGKEITIGYLNAIYEVRKYMLKD